MTDDIFNSTCSDGEKCRHRCGGRDHCFRAELGDTTSLGQVPVTSLDDLVAGIFGDDEYSTALANSTADQDLMAELAQTRRDRYPDIEKFAAAIGAEPADVRAFERLGADPHLSTVRRYARHLGIQVSHRVFHTYVDVDMDELRSALVPLVPVQVHRVADPSGGDVATEPPRTVVPVRIARTVKGMNPDWVEVLYIDTERRVYELSDGIFHRLDDEAEYVTRPAG